MPGGPAPMWMAGPRGLPDQQASPGHVGHSQVGFEGAIQAETACDLHRAFLLPKRHPLNEERPVLEDRAALVGSAVHVPTLSDPNASLVDQITIFRDRGLSSDSAIPIEFGIEQALLAIRAGGTISQIGGVSNRSVLM